MKKFQKAHLWLTIPFLIAFLGFYFSYWSTFKEASFQQHLHGLSATAWYVLLIVQPYLYQRSNMNLHRILGTIGLFLAGGVVFSALQIIPNNLKLENISENLRYSFVFADFVFVFGFSYSVVMAILKKKDVDLHARYLFSSTFWVMLPALARLLYFPMLVAYGYPTPISFNQCVYLASGLIILVLCILIYADFRKEKRIYSPYVLVAITSLIVLLLWDYFGEADWWRSFCHTVLQ
ncbi:hypothetical protein [Maribacter cobaltidurans]|uniref:Uncharacterized protein n=1 Tax=Maribacter cobaltidurans TaxID=1178778 RepID=A0A223VA88_9FLAO|nr:hypothetical protein [Maribacter cobaltidurans]ASV31779.1 hypothetical protein CJ263_17020 [Maribacter cobaltidurans]GGD93106.1 hypothetical protein GCM10011412_33780 [Maribacter cobaltidurans]